MIPEQIPVNQYYGNNSDTTFDFDFFIEDDDELKVTLTDSDGTQTVLVKDVDYIIHEIGNINGSYITYPYITEQYQSTHGILSSNEILTLELALPIKQPAEYSNSNTLLIKNIEKSLDNGIRINQILNANINKIKERELKINDEIYDKITNFENKEVDARTTFEESVNNSLSELRDDIELLENTVNNTISNSLTAEISNRESADSTLQNNIDTLSSYLLNETTIRDNADTTLQNNIDTVSHNLELEIINRQNGDISVSNRLQTREQAIRNTINDSAANINLRIENEVETLNNTISTEVTDRQNADTTLQNNIDTINSKIPSQASSSNPLADQNFVNSSIATATATFRGTYNSVADLEAYTGAKDNNDYAFVTGTDSLGNAYFDNYVYNGTAWLYRWRLNNSSFTAEQWEAINSAITRSDVALIRTAIQPSDLGKVATSSSYNDLIDKPNIPAEQVQSDWDVTNTSSKAYIKNKPNIPAEQVQSDWNVTNANSKAYIKNKPTIPDTSNMATTNTTQTISGQKTLTVPLNCKGLGASIGFYKSNDEQVAYIENSEAQSTFVDDKRTLLIGNYATNVNEETYLGFTSYYPTYKYKLVAPLARDVSALDNALYGRQNFYLPLAFTDGLNFAVTNNIGVVDLSSLDIGGGITVDTALSTTSENPVQNKVITDALNGKVNTSDYVAYTANEVETLWESI